MTPYWYPGLLLILVALLGGCEGVSERAALAQERGKPPKPQGGSKLKVTEIETDLLRMSAGEPGVLVQYDVDGLVMRTPPDVLLQTALNTPATMQQKRMVPRVQQATIAGTQIRLPGPAEADRVLVALPDGTEPLTMSVPRDPPAGAQPVAVAEAVVVQVQGQATQPHAVPVQFERGYVAASGLQLPTWLSPGAYYRIEWSGTVWMLVAMSAQTTSTP